MTLPYVKYKRTLLRSRVVSEKWLQQRIAGDTSLLGLGELDVKDLERSQPRAGRLNMLPFAPETNTRYEVEAKGSPATLKSPTICLRSSVRSNPASH